MNRADEQENLLRSVLNQSYEIEGNEEYHTEQEKASPHFYLVDEEDRDIIMHRDAHFGNSFPLMLHAYKTEARSAVLDTSIRRIESLALQEAALKQNIAPLLLTGADAEKVAMARKLYQDLREICEAQSAAKPTVAVAIAELILAEEEPTKEIANVIKHKERAIPHLLQVISSSHFRDSLFPGYGFAPIAAAKALGKLKATAAIPALFDLLREYNFDYDEAAIAALHAIGDPAKEFLIKQLRAQPISESNERAATALTRFNVPDDVQEEMNRLLKWPQ
jgi:hypothetical protein